MKKRKFENGELVSMPGWCDLCGITFGSSASPCHAKHLDGKFYHPHCYPQAVEIFLADKKIEEYERKVKKRIKKGISLDEIDTALANLITSWGKYPWKDPCYVPPFPDTLSNPSK